MAQISLEPSKQATSQFRAYLLGLGKVADNIFKDLSSTAQGNFDKAFTQRYKDFYKRFLDYKTKTLAEIQTERPRKVWEPMVDTLDLYDRELTVYLKAHNDRMEKRKIELQKQLDEERKKKNGSADALKLLRKTAIPAPQTPRKPGPNGKGTVPLSAPWQASKWIVPGVVAVAAAAGVLLYARAKR